jgi:Arc/MetJ-type ribon-helix-helix transcriptional regulator
MGRHMTTELKHDSINIGTRITEPMQKAIDHILKNDGHVNKADYVRDLIRKDLEKRGVLLAKGET